VRGDDVIDSTSGSNLITILINTTDINRLPFAFGRRTLLALRAEWPISQLADKPIYQLSYSRQPISVILIRNQSAVIPSADQRLIS
jgi:hypothetical protein